MNTRWKQIADHLLGPRPERHRFNDRSADARFCKAVMVGICYEMPAVRPSTPELVELLGGHNFTIQSSLKHWNQLPWRERYGWLCLAEAVAQEQEKERRSA